MTPPVQPLTPRAHATTVAYLDSADSAAATYLSARSSIRSLRRELAGLIGASHVARSDIDDARIDESDDELRVQLNTADDKQRTIARLAGEASDSLARLVDHLDQCDVFHATLRVTATTPKGGPNP